MCELRWSSNCWVPIQYGNWRVLFLRAQSPVTGIDGLKSIAWHTHNSDHLIHQKLLSKHDIDPVECGLWDMIESGENVNLNLAKERYLFTEQIRLSFFVCWAIRLQASLKEMSCGILWPKLVPSVCLYLLWHAFMNSCLLLSTSTYVWFITKHSWGVMILSIYLF